MFLDGAGTISVDSLPTVKCGAKTMAAFCPMTLPLCCSLVWAWLHCTALHGLSYSVGNGAGTSLQSVRGNITDLSLINGVVGACVHGEFNSQLILKGVMRRTATPSPAPY